MDEPRAVTLAGGVRMPRMGFGVYQVPTPADCERVVTEALHAGYRLIDTAAAYFSEEPVGRALAASGIPRQEMFVATKLWIQDASEAAARAAFERSLTALGLDYLDLYLIHQPFGDYYGAWRTMQELQREGLVRAIGVTNFYPGRLMDLAVNSGTVPAVNQVECHPFFQQREALAVMGQLGVHPQAWGPLAEGRYELFTHPVLAAIGLRYGKTPAQVALRWNLQRGVTVLPKTVHTERMVENFDIWDFRLDAHDMEEITTLDLGRSELIDHDAPGVARWLSGFRIHD